MFLKLLLVLAILVDKSFCLFLPCTEIILFHSYPFFSLGLLIAIIIRHLLKNKNVVTLNGVFLLLLGIVFGLISKYCEHLREHFLNIDFVELRLLFLMYIPLLCFSMAFSINVNTFLRSLFQIIIISIPVAATNICFNGFIMKIVLGDNWSADETLYFGIMMNPIYPIDMLVSLKQTGAQVKHVCTLLEGETLVGMGVSMYFLDNFIDSAEGMTWQDLMVQETLAFLAEIFVGLTFGLIARYMMRKNMTDIKNLVMITVGFPMLGCFLTHIADGDGPLAVCMMGMFMGSERASLQIESYTFIQVLWKLINYAANVFLFLYCGVIFTLEALPLMDLQDFALTFVTFLMVNVGRFFSFFLFVPILSRIGYGMSFSHMLVCVWGGLRSPFMLLLSVVFYIKYRKKEFIIHAFGVYIWSLIINGATIPILLNVLGLSQISLTRQTNMNNCMRYVIEARERIIDVLKMDRFLSDANWAMAQKLTSLEHPYKLEMDIQDNENEVWAIRATICPDCQKDVIPEPTSKEFREMTREARMRVLKAKRISYAQQFANGLLSKNALATLTQAVEVAMDTKEAIIELEGLEKLFKKETFFYRLLRKLMSKVYKVEKEGDRVPIKVWRQWCRVITKHIAFDIFMSMVIVVNFATILFELFYSPKEFFFGLSDEMLYIFAPISFAFLSIYLAEFVMRIFGYSFISIWKHGIPTYFKSFWNCFDFFFLLITTVDAFITLFHYIHHMNHGAIVFNVHGLNVGLKITQLFRALRFLHFVKPLISIVVQFIDHTTDAHREYVYDVGKGYLTAAEEILQVLNHMIDNEKILEDMRKRLENDRLTLIKLLATVQKERPWIAVTVKTRQTCRAVLSSMKDAVNELKVSGWVDDTEYTTLIKTLRLNDKSVNNIRSVSPCAPRVLFDNVMWLKSCKSFVREYIYSRITTKKFDPGDIVYRDGEIAEGIYIVVNGLFLLSYMPQLDVMEALEKEGKLPVAEFMPIKKYKKIFFDYIVTGNCIGTLSSITKRQYTSTIISETYSQVYLIKRSVLIKAMNMDRDPVKGFECQLWKGIAMRIALTVLLQIPAYQSYTHDKLRNMLERGFVPNIKNYKTFMINEMISAVVLIEGMAVEAHTGELLIAPCFIPRSSSKLILPPSSSTELTELETKLLIIPTPDTDEYDIMAVEEESCELVDLRSSLCIQHKVSSSARSTMNLRQRRIKEKKLGMQKDKMPSKSRISLNAIMESDDDLKEAQSMFVFDETKTDRKSKRGDDESKV